MTRIRSFSLTNPDGETVGQVFLVAMSDGGLSITTEEWGEWEEEPAVITASGVLSDDETDALREWLNESTR